MSFSETAPGQANPQELRLEAVERTQLETNQALVGLNQELVDQWPDLPPHAAQYILTNCQSPAHIDRAVNEVRLLLQDNPRILDDSALAEMFVSDCVKSTEIAALDDGLKQDSETIASNENANEQRRTTVEGLKNQIEGNLEGADKAGQLQALIQQVKDQPDFPEAERAAALVHLGQIAVTLDEMTNVFTDPASQTAFTQILDTSPIDLGASSPSDTFAPVMAKVEVSGVFAESDKRRLRDIITGSDVQDVLSETDAEGNPLYSSNNKRELRPGVSGYVEGDGNQIIEAQLGNGHIVKQDVTGWSGEAVGRFVEVTTFANQLEQYGLTGFMKSVYHIDFAVIGDAGLTPDTTREMQWVMGLLLGGMEDSDGAIIKPEQRSGYLHYLARLLSKQDSATGFENNQAATDDVIQELNLRLPDGSPHHENMRTLGQFARRTYLSGDASYDDLKAEILSSERAA